MFYNGSVMVFLAEVYKIEEIFGKAKTDCKIHNFSQNFIYTKKAVISVIKIFCLYNSDTNWYLKFAQNHISKVALSWRRSWEMAPLEVALASLTPLT